MVKEKKPVQARKKRSNDDDDDDAPQRQKKAKTAKAPAKTEARELISGTDNEGNPYWEISYRRRVTISEFKGSKLVSIREYYDKDGEMKPGQKGISLSIEQYQALVNSIGAINACLKSQDIVIHDGSAASSKESKKSKETKDAEDEKDEKDDEDDEEDEE